jgi:hypothetical protein
MKREISSKAFDELTAKKVAYICSWRKSGSRIFDVNVWKDLYPTVQTLNIQKQEKKMVVSLHVLTWTLMP